MEDVPAFASQGLLRGNAGDGAGRPVEKGDVPVRVHGEHAVGQGLHDGVAGDVAGQGHVGSLGRQDVVNVPVLVAFFGDAVQTSLRDLLDFRPGLPDPTGSPTLFGGAKAPPE